MPLDNSIATWSVCCSEETSHTPLVEHFFQGRRSKCSTIVHQHLCHWPSFQGHFQNCWDHLCCFSPNQLLYSKCPWTTIYYWQIHLVPVISPASCTLRAGSIDWHLLHILTICLTSSLLIFGIPFLAKKQHPIHTHVMHIMHLPGVLLMLPHLLPSVLALTAKSSLP